MSDNSALRKHLLELLRGHGAHADFETAVRRFPTKLRGARAAELPFTPWKLLEHMRIAQWDILEFSRIPKHTSPKWPEGYWPKSDAPPSPTAWEKSIKTIQLDRGEMQALVKNPKTDLFAPIPHGEGQTILREALLMADHNSYHLGQFILLRRLLGAWKGQ